MDRREAIRVIKELLADRDNDSRYPCVSSPRHHEALDLAIEALGRTDTDCISRADTIKAMCQECKVFPDDEVNCADCTEVAIVRGMPSVSGEEVDYCNNCPYISYNNEDCISRQQAIEALTGWQTEPLDEDIVRTLESLPPVPQKQVTSKLKNPCDSLLKPDSDERKEQKSKLDCISRQQAIEALTGWETEPLDEDIVRTLNNLPQVTPTERTGEWIPTSERLPKAEDMCQPPEQRYLCQLEAYGERKFCVLSRLKGAVSPFWDWYGVAVHDSEVIAWMPLPEPYKGE